MSRRKNNHECVRNRTKFHTIYEINGEDFNSHATNDFWKEKTLGDLYKYREDYKDKAKWKSENKASQKKHRSQNKKYGR